MTLVSEMSCIVSGFLAQKPEPDFLFRRTLNAQKTASDVAHAVPVIIGLSITLSLIPTLASSLDALADLPTPRAKLVHSLSSRAPRERAALSRTAHQLAS